MSQGGANKVRVDINVTAATKHLLDGIVAAEREDDRAHNRPERSRSAILEMVFRDGAEVWNQKRLQERPEGTERKS